MKDYSLRNEKSRLIQALATSLHEHITELFENGYDQGYADAKSELGENAIDLAHEESDRAYQQGLEDAWEAAKKIARMDTETSENVTGYFGLFRIMDNLTAAEAIAKIKEYEEQREQDTEIKVGDEVYSKMYDLRFIVTRIYDGRYEGICTDGTACCPLPNDVKKTGRHTETILKVLGEFYEKD